MDQSINIDNRFIHVNTIGRHITLLFQKSCRTRRIEGIEITAHLRLENMIAEINVKISELNKRLKNVVCFVSKIISLMLKMS